MGVPTERMHNSAESLLLTRYPNGQATNQTDSQSVSQASKQASKQAGTQADKQSYEKQMKFPLVEPFERTNTPEVLSIFP
ncbi:hypothetical protein M0802_003249 [Mischocyttarus mexicanus]|nr:hypothetical protein M0802_003249 [Mischocyttarus mexicanus]